MKNVFEINHATFTALTSGGCLPVNLPFKKQTFGSAFFDPIPIIFKCILFN